MLIDSITKFMELLDSGSGAAGMNIREIGIAKAMSRPWRCSVTLAARGPQVRRSRTGAMTQVIDAGA